MVRFRRKRPRALVTNAAGFLGGHLIDRLIADGHDVVAVDDLCVGRIEHLAEAISTGHCTYVFGDLHDSTRSTWRIIEEVRGFQLSEIYYLENARTAVAIDGAATALLDLALEDGATFIYASLWEPDQIASIPTHTECVVSEAVRTRGLNARIFRVSGALASRSSSAARVVGAVDALLSVVAGPNGGMKTICGQA